MYYGSHYRMMSIVGGVVLVVLGILWWMSNNGSLDPEFWDWLLPLLVIVWGVSMLMMPMCKCEGCCETGEHHKKHDA